MTPLERLFTALQGFNISKTHLARQLFPILALCDVEDGLRDHLVGHQAGGEERHGHHRQPEKVPPGQGGRQLKVKASDGGDAEHETGESLEEGDGAFQHQVSEKHTTDTLTMMTGL